MTTNVTIEIQAKENVLRVPETATRFKPSKEIWESFGLKWDEELLNAGRKAMQAAAEKTAKEMKQATPANAAPKTDAVAKAPKGKKMPTDSPKARNANSRKQSDKPVSFAGGSGSRRTRTSVVWVMEGNTPKPVAVKVGISDGANVEIIEGIDAKATLITGVKYNDPKQANSNAPATGPGMGRRF
jgi:hypothetical protein